MLMVKGILRIGIGNYKLDLRISILEMQSDIYYRIEYIFIIKLYPEKIFFFFIILRLIRF